MYLSISVAARASPLSQVQVWEVWSELNQYHQRVTFCPLWIKTQGDIDQKTSLRTREKTPFFTREIDILQLAGKCRIAIHSAKDLPEPLPEGLVLIALTKGIDSSDVLVLRENEAIETLPLGARIGTSSVRREEAILALRSDFVCVDVRGTIEQRLQLLDSGKVEGLAMAEAALIRLGLRQRRRVPLPGEIAEGQGRLAVIARKNDKEMHALFACIDTRGKYT